MGTTTQSKREVLAAIDENRETIASYGVRRIGLFGSFAQDRQTEASDIDLLVEFEPRKKTFDTFMGLSFFLEDLLKRRVELVTTEGLSPHIGPHILAEAEYVAIAN